MQDYPTHDFFQEDRLNYRKPMFLNEIFIENNMNLSLKNMNKKSRVSINTAVGLIFSSSKGLLLRGMEKINTRGE